MWQVIVKIPTPWTTDGIPVYGFGLMLFLAFVLCTWLARARAPKEGIDPDAVDALAIWIFLGGLAGARLTSMLSIPYYPPLLDPPGMRAWIYKFVSIWDGGIVLYGAVAGGVASFFLAYWLYYRPDASKDAAGKISRRVFETFLPAVIFGLAALLLWGAESKETPWLAEWAPRLTALAVVAMCYFLYLGVYYTPGPQTAQEGLPVRRFLDAVAPSVALGLVLGRMGCFFNGCCYGQVAAAACLAVTPVGFPMCAPPRETTVIAGCQTVAGFTHGIQQAGKGAVVGKVDPASPAYAAGLREGAVIVAVNGSPITSAGQLDTAIGLQSWPRGRTLLEIDYEPTPGAPVVSTSFRPFTLGLYPTQLYEVMSMFLLMLVLLAYTPLRHNPGQVTAVLMAAYGVHRYLNELLRDDPRPKGLESYGSVFLVAGGLLMWLWLNARPADAPVARWEPKPEGGTQPQGDARAIDQHVTDRPVAADERLKPLGEAGVKQ